MCPSTERDRERLEREIAGNEYHELLRDLQGGNPFFRRFKTWADVLAFMRNGTSSDPQKDEVLRPILTAHATDQNPRLRTILLAIFWPGLESIHFKKRHWDPEDPDELWQNIAWTFLEVVCRIDVSTRPSRLVQKIYNDTVYNLHNAYRRAWDRAACELNSECEEPIRALVGDLEGVNFVLLALREEKEAAIQRLRTHMEAGRIREIDYLLLVGTRVYESPLAEYALEIGINYQFAKKRRQRAEAIIARFEEKMR
ncbi:MAG: hypothetical protein HY914_11050 [Desulfomonile tiedjei]|nr:hypothetical protein [Desulfomonile tiedjei]